MQLEDASRGVLNDRFLRLCQEVGVVEGLQSSAQIQPGSMDLTIADEIYRIRGSYLPRSTERIEELARSGKKVSLKDPLIKNATYLIRLNESLNLPRYLAAKASAKSSTGRINLRVRLLADGVSRFDSVPAGYHGSLWLEMVSKSFPVLLHPGDALNQLRLFGQSSPLSPMEHDLLCRREGLLRSKNGLLIIPDAERDGQGIDMTVNLQGSLCAWKARKRVGTVLDTAYSDHLSRDFFEEIRELPRRELLVRAGDFYILATAERIVVPPGYSADMQPYDPTKGEFRSHFAGFFDPGFGWHSEWNQRGWAAVLELSTHDHSLVLRHGQPICRLVFEHMVEAAERSYGHQKNSHYTGQSQPRLAKWFVL